MNQQDKDFEYFLENMEQLYKVYGHKFVAVKNQNFLGYYDSFNEALESTLKTEELGTFLIQECKANRGELVHHFQGNVVPIPA